MRRGESLFLSSSAAATDGQEFVFSSSVMHLPTVTVQKGRPTWGWTSEVKEGTTQYSIKVRSHELWTGP